MRTPGFFILQNPVPRPTRPFRYQCKPYGFGPRPPAGDVTITRLVPSPLAELVRVGLKLQDVYAPRWIIPEPGDRLILQTRVGKSIRTIRTTIITSVTPITIPSRKINDAFAIAEGYRSRKALLKAFKLPFRGVLIRWNPPQLPTL